MSAPYGPLAVYGTHWLEDHPDGCLPGISGVWLLDGDAVVLSAPEDGLTLDGEPFTGSVRLGGRRLVVLIREGSWGVRDHDPDSAARRAFRGIEATPYDSRRGLGLSGELAFRFGGLEVALQVAVQDDGRLWAVFADSTSGNGSYRFRFLYPGAPDAEGRTTVDLNRAVLPPCAFADHFICPFPPPGNTLGVAIEAGERTLRQTGHRPWWAGMWLSAAG